MPARPQVLIDPEEALDFPSLENVEPAKIDSPALRAALERIRDRRTPSHSSYHTRHTSHSMYSSGW
jgi:hypothetical protein